MQADALMNIKRDLSELKIYYYFYRMKMLRWILFPIAILYGLVTIIRNLLFELAVFPSKSYPVPVIAVGNLSVGGTGKTPHIEYLIEMFSNQCSVAVVSRGYKRKTKGLLVVNNTHTAIEAGDEMFQLKSKFPNTSIVVSENRRKGIDYLLKNNSAPLIILLDDAFQHRWVQPGLSILLTSYDKPFSNDYILPLGYLRECRQGAGRADIIIMTKFPKDLQPDSAYFRKQLKITTKQSLFFSRIRYGELLAVMDKTRREVPMKAVDSIILICGIAHPEPLQKYLSGFCKNLILFKFADHYQFSEKDLEKVKDKFIEIKHTQVRIITTEKDFARMQNTQLMNVMANLPLYVLPITIEVDDEKVFKKKIADYVGKNQ